MELAQQMKPLDADIAAILYANLDSLYIEDEPAAAPGPEPLTDEEALRLWAGDAPRPVMGKNKVLAFTRAIERAHNIKGDKA